MLNEDYRDMLQALSDEKVRFLLVGAYALAVHGYPRATMDMDIWVKPSPDNADAVLRALRRGRGTWLTRRRWNACGTP
jgi:hypothetical protein